MQVSGKPKPQLMELIKKGIETHSHQAYDFSSKYHYKIFLPSENNVVRLIEFPPIVTDVHLRCIEESSEIDIEDSENSPASISLHDFLILYLHSCIISSVNSKIQKNP